MTLDKNIIYADLRVVLGVVILLLVLVAGGWTIWQNHESEQQQRCLTHWANELTETVQTRTQASTRADRLTDELWLRIRKVLQQPDEDSRVPQLAARINRYLKLRDQAVEAQRNNPYPPPPKFTC